MDSVVRPSWYKMLVPSEENSLQHVWNVLAQNGVFESSVDVRFRQIVAASPAVDITFADRVAVSVPSEAKTSVDPCHGLEYAAEAGDSPVVGVLVDRPWQLAFGLIPISSDSGTQARREPIGWVETYLALRAQVSPLHVAFSAELFDATADSSSLAWAGTPLGSLDLSGDFSAGFTLGAISFEVDRLTVGAGSDYNLVSDDNFVAAGNVLTIEATALSDDDRMMFDGSAETDGAFSFLGGESNDFFFGGAGGDWITGSGGADVLSGGGGADVFIYHAASESSGAGYDTIADFDPAVDRIDLFTAITSFDPAIAHGALSTASFAQDLSALLGGLGASQAVWLAADAGDLAGTVFLIADGNGITGYQHGEDYVFAIGGAALEDLSGHTGFFV